LRNPLYAGNVRAGDEVCDGEHEAIVTDFVWACVQAKLRAQAPARRSRPGRRSSALLAGIARCVCGAALTPSSTRKGPKAYVYYICSRAQKQGVASCPGSRIAAGKLESFVVAEIRKIGRAPQFIAAAVTASSADRKEEALRLRAHVTEVRAGRSKLVGERARLITAVGDGNAGDGIMTRIRELDESVQAADIRLRDVEGDLATLTQGDTDPEALTRALADFDGVWDELTLAEGARLLDLLLEAVVYDGPRGDIELRFRPMPAHVTDEVAA
jgi:site-specific DNA recombinase